MIFYFFIFFNSFIKKKKIFFFFLLKYWLESFWCNFTMSQDDGAQGQGRSEILLERWRQFFALFGRKQIAGKIQVSQVSCAST